VEITVLGDVDPELQAMMTLDEMDLDPMTLAHVRSSVHNALAMALSPPTRSVRAWLASARGATHLAEALHLIDENIEVRPFGRVTQLRYYELFGPAARGQLPPYETEYGCESLIVQARELRDIGGFYGAFGLPTDGANAERDDHVACELAFMSFLAAKEAFAIETGDEDTLGATRRGEALFLHDHLGRFAPAFTARLISADQGGFYGRIAEALAMFIATECRRFNVVTGPIALSLRSRAKDAAEQEPGGSRDEPSGTKAPSRDQPA